MRKNTIRYQFSRPVARRRDISMLPLADMCQRCNNWLAEISSNKMVPERAAISFYLMNHLTSRLRYKVGLDDPLTPQQVKLVNTYIDQSNAHAKRMFVYIFLTTTREARHLKGDVPSYIYSKYTHGNEGATLIDTLGDDGYKAVDRFLSTDALMTLGGYLALLTDVFNKMKWSPSFGGKAWGNVTQCLLDFVQGRYSAEALLDTAFTLAHNNGPIFNKPLLYHPYNKNDFIEILDVQRAGQMPQYVANENSQWVHEWHKEQLELGQQVLGVKFDQGVDWQQVMQLGSVNNYSHKVPSKGKMKTASKPKTKWVEAGSVPEFITKLQQGEEVVSEKEAILIYPGLYAYKAPRSLNVQE